MSFLTTHYPKKSWVASFWLLTGLLVPPPVAGGGVSTLDYPFSQDDPLNKPVERAIQNGANYVGKEAVHWQRSYRCLGCHIQTQSLMGFGLAMPKTQIDPQALSFLYNTQASTQQTDGSLWSSSSTTYARVQTSLGLWSMMGYPDKQVAFPTMYKAATYLHNQRAGSSREVYWNAASNETSLWAYTGISQTALSVMGLVDVVRTFPKLDSTQLQEYRLLDSLGLGGGGEVQDVETGADGKVYVLKSDAVVNRLNLDAGPEVSFVTPLLHSSSGLAVASDGTLYLCGAYNNRGRWESRVVRIQTNGKQDVLWFKAGVTLKDIEIGPNGDLYVSDQTTPQILQFSASGAVKGTIFSNLLSSPAGLAFDSQGNLYIANPGNSLLTHGGYAINTLYNVNQGGYNILKRTPNGVITTFTDGLAYPPLWLSFDDQGNLWASSKEFDYGGYTPPGMYKITSKGIAERIFSGPSLRGVTSARGKMWVANASTNRLAEISASQLNTSQLPTFQKDIEGAVSYFFGNYKDNSPDKVNHAMRLMALAEARSVLGNKIKTNVMFGKLLDDAISAEETWLRQRQTPDGGWGRYENYPSDPLITAMVGMSLAYTKPVRTDPIVRKTIIYLLNAQRTDGAWNNVSNGLTTDLAATSFVIAYLPKLLDFLQGVKEVAPASCQFYGVNDNRMNYSQFLQFNTSEGLRGVTLNTLGPRYDGYDLEGLAIDTQNDLLFAVSGNDVAAGKQPGYLYMLNALTGDLLAIGPTGFEEVSSLTFSRDGTLWGWAKGPGLITIDSKIGKGTLVLQSDVMVEELVASRSEDNVLYGAAETSLWKYDPAAPTPEEQLKVVCDNLPGETEALAMLSNSLFLLGTHKRDTLLFIDLDQEAQTCHLVDSNIPTTGFDDIEGLAVPLNMCSIWNGLLKGADNLPSKVPSEILSQLPKSLLVKHLSDLQETLISTFVSNLPDDVFTKVLVNGLPEIYNNGNSPVALINNLIGLLPAESQTEFTEDVRKFVEERANASLHSLLIGAQEEVLKDLPDAVYEAIEKKIAPTKTEHEFTQLVTMMTVLPLKEWPIDLQRVAVSTLLGNMVHDLLAELINQVPPYLLAELLNELPGYVVKEVLDNYGRGGG